jgi:hypothetical protein
VRYRIQGTTLRARAWKEGTSEPSTWTIDTTDTDLSSGGNVALGAAANSAHTNDVTVGIDDVTVNQIGAGVGSGSGVGLAPTVLAFQSVTLAAPGSGSGAGVTATLLVRATPSVGSGSGAGLAPAVVSALLAAIGTGSGVGLSPTVTTHQEVVLGVVGAGSGAGVSPTLAVAIAASVGSGSGVGLDPLVVEGFQPAVWPCPDEDIHVARLTRSGIVVARVLPSAVRAALTSSGLVLADADSGVVVARVPGNVVGTLRDTGRVRADADPSKLLPGRCPE